MADKTLQVVRDIHTILTTDANISAIVGARVYTNLPQKPVFPFIRFTISTEEYSVKQDPMMTYYVQVSCFDQSNSLATVADLRAKVYNALNRNEAGFTASGAWHCQSTGQGPVFKEPDGQTWQSVINFNIKT